LGVARRSTARTTPHNGRPIHQWTKRGIKHG
jgi:hypothetical protein